MGEKLKDIIYDFSDIILSLVIITIIFAVVSWKISDSMNYDAMTDQATDAVAVDQKNTEQTTAPTDTTVKIDPNAQTTAPTVSGTDGKPAAGVASSNTTTNAATTTNTTTTDTAATTETPTTTTTTTPAPAVTTPTAGDFEVIVPAGSSGYSIAKQLKEKGIITDTKSFISRVEQLKLGSKLKAGTFKIKSGSSLDEVIYTLTGKK